MNAARFMTNDDGLFSIAVAIGFAQSGNTHSGILHRGKDGRLSVLHLRFHCKLENEIHDPSVYSIAVPNLTRDRQKFYQALCRKIVNAHPLIRFALRYGDNSFDTATGQIVLAKDGLGLNCATFVLAIFRSYGFDLVDFSTWQYRAQDAVWHRELVTMVRAQTDCDGPNHATLIASEIGCARVRPEEVAGACLEDALPADFDKCRDNGIWIVARLRGH